MITMYYFYILIIPRTIIVQNFKLILVIEYCFYFIIYYDFNYKYLLSTTS